MAVALVQAGGSTGNGYSSASSLTISLTVTAGANLLRAQAAHAGAANLTISGITYNGVALTQVVEASTTNGSTYIRTGMWALQNPPTGTAYNLVVTFSGSDTGLALGWDTWSGFDHFGTPSTNSVSANTVNPSVTVTDWATGDYAIGAVAANWTTVTAADTQNFYIADNAGCELSGVYQTADGALNWTSALGVWGCVGVSLKPAAGGSSVMPIIANHNMRRRA